MKKVILFCILPIILLSSFASPTKKFPTITLKSLDGQAVELQKKFTKNKLTVISFWATWCSPCKKELDAIKTLYPNWKKDGVEFIAITIDDAQQLNKVKPLIQQKGWVYTILSDINKESLRKLNFQSIPQTFVVDPKGDIVYSHSGYAPGDEQELDKKLKSLLK
ncbi:MAG: TlpA family protein disulfide reductase [Bacteroidota bacterium]|nr:TlpA family protein disulfide reductase [Bacteroidota bacterium]